MKPQPRPLAWLLVFLTGVSALRVWFASCTQLSPDEAYYWTWSQHLAAGYYDHPPAVAFLIRAGTLLLGDTALGVRLGAIGCGFLSPIWLFLATRRLTEKASLAFWFAVLLSVSPLFAVGSVVHTPDAPLMLFWSLGLWLALKAYDHDRWWNWAGLGACIGLACMSKASGAGLAAGLLLFGVSSKAGRSRMLGTGPVLAAFVAALIWAPGLDFDLHHAGGALAFQWQHGTGQLALMPGGFLEFTGSQIGVLSPLLWFGLMAFVLAGWRREVRFGRSDVFLMWCLSGPWVLGFLGLSWLHKVEANWAGFAYLAALPGLAWACTGGLWYLRRRRAWLVAALALSLVPTILIHLQTLAPFLPVEESRDPTARLRGQAAWITQAVKDADALGAQIGAVGYGPVSLLRFYSRGRPVLYEANGTRQSQYDLDPPASLDRTRPLLLLQPVTSQGIPRLCAHAAERWMLDRRDPELGHGVDFRWWVCDQFETKQVDAGKRP